MTQNHSYQCSCFGTAADLVAVGHVLKCPGDPIPMSGSTLRGARPFPFLWRCLPIKPRVTLVPKIALVRPRRTSSCQSLLALMHMLQELHSQSYVAVVLVSEGSSDVNELPELDIDGKEADSCIG